MPPAGVRTNSHAESLATALAALEAQGQTLRMQLEERETRLAAAATELARTQAEREAALQTAQAVAAERDAARTAAQETQHATEGAHARELEALRTEHAEREAALRAQIDQAASRLEGAQKPSCCKPKRRATRGNRACQGVAA